ncbi:unnamed protein product [Polarella glacialis]|uniref:Uncharacterized protein n=1 Tax=Polarella glacialis TaxID=89957 RepID=A0A813H8T4_POLGL|nr:unnamed protein product [Polarella glacialis]
MQSETECSKVNYCRGDCAYCETEAYWDWDGKKSKALCSFVDNADGTTPLQESDCQKACGGSFSELCYFVKDANGTSQACITPPPSDAQGNTVTDKCLGQTKAVANGTVSTARYTLLQCSSFLLSECGWATSQFAEQMSCKISRMQCKNKVDCEEAGRCDYQADEWQIQTNGGICVKPLDFANIDPMTGAVVVVVVVGVVDVVWFVCLFVLSVSIRTQ